MSGRDCLSCAGIVLWRAALRWDRTVTRVLRPLGLTYGQYVLLLTLHSVERRGEQPNQQQLAERAGLDESTTSLALRRLETSGFVQRRTDGADTRAKHVSLSMEGTAVLQRAGPRVRAADLSFFGVDDGSSTRDVLISVLAATGRHSLRPRQRAD